MEIGTKVGNWRVVERLGEGGQGETYVAVDHAGRRACFKVLTDAHVRERRHRFGREAGCFASLSIDGVPTLLASNAIEPDTDPLDPLHLCTELIPGPSLDKVPQGHAPLDEILAGVERLVSIVHQLHAAGVVHRDIKPQNILARDGKLTDLWLVDFGIAFYSLAQDDYRTETGQELGNRFLRLPELHAGSRFKQDPVSDVTLCVGILFYLITGLSPRLLSDGAGRMPHQREEATAGRLREPAFAHLLPVFDKGFRTRTEERFASALQLKDALQAERAADRPALLSFSEIAAELEELGERRMNQRRRHRDQVVDTAHIVAKQMAEGLNGVYVFAQTGHVTTERAVETQTGFALGDDYEAVERVPFKAVIAGSEIVATAWDNEILRVDADVPDWEATLRPAIEEALLRALNTLRAKRSARPI